MGTEFRLLWENKEKIQRNEAQEKSERIKYVKVDITYNYVAAY